MGSAPSKFTNIRLDRVYEYKGSEITFDSTVRGCRCQVVLENPGFDDLTFDVTCSDYKGSVSLKEKGVFFDPGVAVTVHITEKLDPGQHADRYSENFEIARAVVKPPDSLFHNGEFYARDVGNCRALLEILSEKLRSLDPRVVYGVGMGYNCLLAGFVRAGKSSTIRSFLRVLTENGNLRTPNVGENRDTVTTTLELWDHSVNQTDGLNAVVPWLRSTDRTIALWDCFGWQPDDNEGRLKTELDLVLSGQVKFGITRPDGGFSIHASNVKSERASHEGRPHVLIFVVPAEYLLDGGKSADAHLSRYKKISAWVASHTTNKIQELFILTGLDKYDSRLECHPTTEYVSPYCSGVYNYVVSIARSKGFQSSVYPMINYSNEHEFGDQEKVHVLDIIVRAAQIAKEYVSKYEDQQRPAAVPQVEQRNRVADAQEVEEDNGGRLAARFE